MFKVLKEFEKETNGTNRNYKNRSKNSIQN